MRAVLPAALRAFVALLGTLLDLGLLRLRLGCRHLNPRRLGHALGLHLRHATLRLLLALLFFPTLALLHLVATLLLLLLALLHVLASLLLLALLLGPPRQVAVAALRLLEDRKSVV